MLVAEMVELMLRTMVNHALRFPYQIFGPENALVRNSIGNMLLMVLVVISIILLLGLFLG